MRNSILAPTALLLTAVLSLSNCATIVSKTSYPVSIDTAPEGVQVSITDKKGKEIYRGKSPTAIKLKSGAGFFSRAEYQIRLSAKGYDEKVIPVTFKLNGWYFGNLVFGGLLGLLVVDPASGAMWRIDKESREINQRLTKTTGSTGLPELKVLDVNTLSDEMKKELVRIK